MSLSKSFCTQRSGAQHDTSMIDGPEALDVTASMLASTPASQAREGQARNANARSRWMSRTPLRLMAGALALVAMLTPLSALADARTEARTHFKTGMQLISKKKYAEGIEQLKKAYEILPHPNVTYNIARAYAEIEDFENAVYWAKEYLASDPPDREKVAEVLKELETRAATQRAWAAAEKAQTQPTKPTEGGTTGTPDKPTEAGGTTGTPDKPTEAGGTKPPEQGTGSQGTQGTQSTPGPQGGTDKVPGPDKVSPTGPGLKGPDSQEIVGEARTEDVYQETVVTASRGAQSPLDSPNSTTIITRQDIRLSGITRIPELLRRVAGMDVMQITGGDTNVSMRGFNSRLSNKLLVLVNGRYVQNDFLGSTFWESLSIDVDQIERIEIVRGPGSALYGANAFAGIVNIITIAPGAGKSGLRVGYGDGNQMYGSIWATARDGDFAYRASAGFTRYPRWTREVGDGRTDLQTVTADQNVGAQNARIDLRATQRLGPTKELQLGGGFASGTIDMYGVGPFNDYALELTNSDVTAQFKSENFNARAYYQRATAHATQNSAYIGHDLYPTDPEQNSFGTEAEFVGHFAAPSALQHEIHVGLSYKLKKIDWSYLQEDPPIEHHGAAFLQDTIKIGKYVTGVLSGRLDYVPYSGRVVPSPRGSVIIKPTDRQAVRFSGSTAFRTTTYLESYLDLPIQLQLPGAELISSSKRQDDPTFVLDPEQIITGEASYLNQQSDYFEFELTGYYNRITDLIVLAEPRVVTLSSKQDGVGGYNPETGRYTVAYGGWKNQCDVYHVVGGEVGGRVYPVEGLDFFANYAINYSSQSRPSGCDVPEDNRTSRHKVNVGVQVRTPIGIDGEVTFHYQSAQQWNEQVATATGIEYQTFPLPAYSLLNARVGYRFFKNRAEVSATVFNALSGITGDPPQQHPFGNRVGRRFMGFFSYSL